MANIGMMNEAYFVSKNVLIDWINNFCQVRIEKVEHCATGAIYCQIFDAIHPGCIKMSKVDFTVKQEYEYTKNWKLLQNAFNSLGIKKIIPVQRLIKARYQDNLEFLQWMYKYTRDTYNGNPESPEYDAIGRRMKSKGGKEFSGVPGQRLKNNNINNSNNSRTKRNKYSNNNTNQQISRTNNTQSRLNTQQTRNNTNNSRSEGQLKELRNQLEYSQKENNNLKNENTNLRNDKNNLEQKITELNSEYENLAKTAADIEKERDFYFDKVLKCEQICKEFPDQNLDLLKKIYNLLYQTDGDTSQINNNNNNVNNNNIDNNDIENDVNIINIDQNNDNNNDLPMNDDINKFEIQTESNTNIINEQKNNDIDNQMAIDQ